MSKQQGSIGKISIMQINWPRLFIPLVSCEEKWQVFQSVIHLSLDTIIPAKPIKIRTADAPWTNV